MAMGMGIQPTATPPTATTPPTMATLTLTVHDITDIGGHSTGHTWAIAVPTMPGLMAGAIDAPTMPGLMAGAIDAPTMRDRTAGDIAGHTGGSCWHPGPGCLPDDVRGPSPPAPVFVTARKEQRERRDLGAD